MIKLVFAIQTDNWNGAGPGFGNLSQGITPLEKEVFLLEERNGFRNYIGYFEQNLRVIADALKSEIKQ